MTSRELIVDSFAGGGGASLGISLALGRAPDVAINHDPQALAMHAANHPATLHLPHNVWKVDPVAVCAGRPVGLLWASPDCKHFSKAKGGKPVARNIRDLAWVVVRWARQVRPRVICLENVEEFRTWGPLAEDNRPCPEHKGETFKRWVGELTRLGYRVEHRELRACDYGAPTIRKRLFLVARCDGRPIAWPAPTHGDPKSAAVQSGKLKTWRTAAEIIDWSLPCPSIFLSREEARALGVKRPLADATMARIAKGVKRYVLDAAEPFIVRVNHGDSRGRRVRGLDEPISTLAASRSDALVAAHLTKFNTGSTGADVSVSAGLVNLQGSDRRSSAPDAPHPTVTAQGGHAAEVRAFLVKYYGEGGTDQSAGEPLHTVPTKARFGLVTIAGETYQIADIGMRMLTPRELFRAQGFPDSYMIDRGMPIRDAGVSGAGVPARDDAPLALTQSAQIRMCGNSVSPPVAAALVAANYCADEADKPDARAVDDGPLFKEAV